jgi:hypothetical protein
MSPSNVLIGIDAAQLAHLMKGLDEMPEAIIDAAVDEAAPYLVEVLKQYPPQKHVTRKQAYGKSFFSDKQRRWFFAALNAGEIDSPYKRTQGLRNAWQIIGSGKNTIIVNDSEGAPFVMGDQTQSRHERMVGWETVSRVVADRAKKLGDKLEAGAKKAMRKLGFHD